MVNEVDGSASAEGVKRSADGPPDGSPPEKVAKVDKEGKEEKKEKKEKKEDKDKDEKKEKKSENREKAAKKFFRLGSHKDVGKEKAPMIKKASTSEFDLRNMFKVGQRFVTPPLADPTRGFYESLLAENENSKIAIKFCVEYGLFGVEKHKELFQKYNYLKNKGAFNDSMRIKRALEKKVKAGMGDKENKSNKDKKDKDGKDKHKDKEKDGKEKHKDKEKEKHKDKEKKDDKEKKEKKEKKEEEKETKDEGKKPDEEAKVPTPPAPEIGN